MARPKVTRTPARRKPRQKTARFTPEDRAELREKVQKRADAPNPLATDDRTLYDGGEIRGDLPIERLVVAMFDAPTASKTGNPAADFLAGVLLSNADEIEAALAMENGLDNTDVIDRIRMRTGYRAAIAVEIARRVAGKAQVQP